MFKSGFNKYLPSCLLEFVLQECKCETALWFLLTFFKTVNSSFIVSTSDTTSDNWCSVCKQHSQSSSIQIMPCHITHYRQTLCWSIHLGMTLFIPQYSQLYSRPEIDLKVFSTEYQSRFNKPYLWHFLHINTHRVHYEEFLPDFNTVWKLSPMTVSEAQQKYKWRMTGPHEIKRGERKVRQQEATQGLFKDTKTTKTTLPFMSTDLVIKVGHGDKTKAISLCSGLLDLQCPAAWLCYSSFHQKRHWQKLTLNFCRWWIISGFPHHLKFPKA